MKRHKTAIPTPQNRPPEEVNRTLADRPPRTLLEQRIRQRRMTFDEFVQHAEVFARDNDEPGTLSLRHLQRLASGQPIGALRPATARLLEHLFGEPITALLAPPKTTVVNENEDSGTELRQLLDTARRVDRSTIKLLHQQLDTIRRLDRQLGAIVVCEELKAKIRQLERLAAHSLAPGAREPLAALLSEMYTLAGWQALDIGGITDSWQYYEKSRAAAAQSGSKAYECHAAAEQAFVLIDAGATRDAVDLLHHARRRADTTAPRILRAWLAAAYGEALAAHGDRSTSLHALDQAAQLLPDDPTTDERPYVALDTIHLARWRGHALARLDDSNAIEILTDALTHLDRSFVRAETGLHVDLASALANAGHYDEARTHAYRAGRLAAEIGSVRQRRRVKALTAAVAENDSS